MTEDSQGQSSKGGPEGTPEEKPSPPAEGQVKAPEAKSEEPTFFDPTKVDQALMPALKQMQGAFTKKMQGLSGREKHADMMEQVLADPDFAFKVAKQIAESKGRQDLLSSGTTTESEESIPEDVLTDAGKFGQYLDEKVKTKTEALVKAQETRFETLLAQRDTEIHRLKMAGAEKEYPLLSQPEIRQEVEELIQKHGLPTEQAYNAATAALREELAKRQARDELKRKADEAEGSFFEGEGSPGGATTPKMDFGNEDSEGLLQRIYEERQKAGV